MKPYLDNYFENRALRKAAMTGKHAQTTQTIQSNLIHLHASLDKKTDTTSVARAPILLMDFIGIVVVYVSFEQFDGRCQYNAMQQLFNSIIILIDSLSTFHRLSLVRFKICNGCPDYRQFLVETRLQLSPHRGSKFNDRSQLDPNGFICD